MRSLKRYVTSFILLLVFVPATSHAVYSLSAFYANVQSFVFSYIGGVDITVPGYTLNSSFGYGRNDLDFASPGSIAVDAANDFLYVADAGNYRVKKYILSTGVFVGSIGNSLIASGTCVVGAQSSWCKGGDFDSDSGDGMFGSVNGIAINVAADFLYVVDGFNYRVQRFVLSTGAFSGSIGRSTASGTCISGKQNTWCTGGNFSGGTGNGQFFIPSGIALDIPADSFYVTDPMYGRVQKFVLSTGAYVGGIGKSLAATGGCVVGKQTSFCAGSFATGAGDGMFNLAGMMAVDSANGFLFVVDAGNYRIQKFTTAGVFVGAIGNSTLSGSCAAGAQSGWCTGGVFSTGTTDGTLGNPFYISLDSTNGFFYVSDNGNNRINKFNTASGAFVGSIGNSLSSGTCAAGIQTSWCTGGSFSAGLSDGMFSSLQGIAVDPVNDRIYVGDGGWRIQRLTLSNATPSGAFGKRITPTTNWSQSAVNAGDNPAVVDGAFYNLTAIAMDYANDFMYTADLNSSRIVKTKISTGAFVGAIGNSLITKGTCVAGKQNGWCVGGLFSSANVDGGFSSAPTVAIDTANDRLYVGDYYRVQKFILSTGVYVGTIGYSSVAAGTCVAASQNTWCVGGTFASGSTDGRFYGVASLAVDPINDRLYVLEVYNYRVQKFVLSTGAFIGVIGKSTASGTCVAGKQNGWCTGGVFSSSGGIDGGFEINSRLAIDITNDRLYVAGRDMYRVQKFILSTGVYVGSIGKSTASGTCVAGAQNNWCTGGVFSAGTTDGAFAGPFGMMIDATNDFFYVVDSFGYKVQKFKLSTGAYIGSMGYATAASGTCLKGKQKTWCTGGNFTTSSAIGGFISPTVGALDIAKKRMYLIDSSRILKVTWN